MKLLIYSDRMQKWWYLIELIHDLFFNEIHPDIQVTSLPPVGRGCYYSPTGNERCLSDWLNMKYTFLFNFQM